MAKRTTWTRLGPDGAEVPLERRDLGLTLHGVTTYSGSDAARWIAWGRDMRSSTGAACLAQLERAARAILRHAGIRPGKLKVPRRASGVSSPSELKAAERLFLSGKRPPTALERLRRQTERQPQTPAWFAGRALEQAATARGAIADGDADTAASWTYMATGSLWIATLKRSFERDTLRGRKDRRDKSAGGRRQRSPSEAAKGQIAAFERLRAEGRGDREAGAILARKAGAQEPEEVRRRADAIRRRARHEREKVGRS